MKIRFLEPGNRPYKRTPLNYFVYDRYIRKIGRASCRERV